MHALHYSQQTTFMKREKIYHHTGLLRNTKQEMGCMAELRQSLDKHNLEWQI